MIPTRTSQQSASIPDDIRLKCSYYASEIRTQVGSLYEEHHKWLEDHLSEIQETFLNKHNDKKAGSRAVIAGIIKTPSRKRTQKPSKKTSKPDPLAGPHSSKHSSKPLSELKRSQLNIDSLEIQEIIQQQLQRERTEIESRLQKEISSLEHQYESPVKKASNGSTLNLADRANHSPTLLWNPLGSLLPAKSTATSSLSGPFNSIHPSFPPLLPSTTKPTGHSEPIHNAPSSSSQDARGREQSPVTDSRLDSTSNLSPGGQLDANDAFAIAGHELSAIQEGEEEDDSHLPPSVPASLVPHKPFEKVLASPIHVSKLSEARHPSPPSPSPPNKSTTPPPQLENTVPPAPDKTTTPPLQSYPPLEAIKKALLHPQDGASSNQPPQKQASSSGSSSAPETNSADARALDSDPIAPQTLSSSEPPLRNISPVATSVAQSQPDGAVPSEKVATSNTSNLSSSQFQPIAYPFALLPSAVLTPSAVPEAPSGMAIRPSTSEIPVVDKSKSGSSMSLSSNLDGVHPPNTGRDLAPSSLITAASSIKQESEENLPQPQLREATRSTGPEKSHIDTVVEVPLNDNPSSLRNNLYSSIGYSQSDRLPEHQTRTPGEYKTNNLFTPGNARATFIQSPHSKWSAKPSGGLWTQHKPLKTPGASSNLGTVGQHERHKSGFSGSPIEDLPKPFSLLSNLQSTTVQQSIMPDAPRTSLLAQSNPSFESQDPRRTGFKRTSTDAGFNHTSDAHDAKISRSHAPGMMNIRSSITSGTGRKGMEDLKNRLSKIQRESAMHDRVHHHSAGLATDAPINANQSTSLVSHNNPAQFTQTLPISAPMPTLSLLSKTSTLATTRRITGDQHDRDRAGEVRNYQPSIHQNFTAPVDLLTSTKSPASNYVTEPIELYGPKATREPSGPPSTMSKGPGDGPISVAHQPNPTRRNSSGSSVGNLVAAHEKKNKALTAEVSVGAHATIDQSNKVLSPLDSNALQPTTTKVESKHLAFLKGASPAVNACPTSPVATMDEAVENTDHAQVVHSPSPHDSPIPEDNVQKHPQTDTEEDEQVNHESIASDKLSEPSRSIRENESGNESNEDDEDRDTHSERQDEDDDNNDNEEEEEKDDDHQNGDLSVEVMSSHGNRMINNNVRAEQHTSDEEDTNQIQPYNNARSELVKTPRNVPAKPSSPVSTGFMGVFKAGAALATSWTASKPKPELKSLQLAAAAAKKDQDEKDRKATLKEERRLLAAEKKQAEEKAKAENVRKARLAEVEKKKQEREEALKARTGLKTKVPLNQSSSTAARQTPMAEDAAKKRKIDNDSNRNMDKKVKAPQPVESHTTTKLPSSAQKPVGSYLPTRVAPTAPGSAIKPSGSKNPAGSSSVFKQTTQQHKPQPPSRPPSQASQYNGGFHGKSTAAPPQLKSSQASQSNSVVTTTTTSTITKNNSQQVLKGKMKKTVEKAQEEYIELPDIDSEYSDDDDSEHERKEAKLPDWAQSPALREALANQRKVNPDDVFGGTIPPPRMEEIFRARASKFRHRTSSANWTGADQLTALEEAEYAKRMGYHSKKKNLAK